MLPSRPSLLLFRLVFIILFCSAGCARGLSPSLPNGPSRAEDRDKSPAHAPDTRSATAEPTFLDDPPLHNWVFSEAARNAANEASTRQKWNWNVEVVASPVAYRSGSQQSEDKLAHLGKTLVLTAVTDLVVRWKRNRRERRAHPFRAATRRTFRPGNVGRLIAGTSLHIAALEINGRYGKTPLVPYLAQGINSLGVHGLRNSQTDAPFFSKFSMPIMGIAKLEYSSEGTSSAFTFDEVRLYQLAGAAAQLSAVGEDLRFEPLDSLRMNRLVVSAGNLGLLLGSESGDSQSQALGLTQGPIVAYNREVPGIDPMDVLVHEGAHVLQNDLGVLFGEFGAPWFEFALGIESQLWYRGLSPVGYSETGAFAFSGPEPEE